MTPLHLEMKLDGLPQFDIRANQSQWHKCHDSALSSASSTNTYDSWPLTPGTEITSTPAASRTSTPSQALRKVESSHKPCKPPIRVVLGTASIGSFKSPLAKINSVTDLEHFTKSFRARGYADIDTARAYPVGRGGTCEQLLGQKRLRLATWANVSTKVLSFLPGSHRAQHVKASIRKSLEALNMDSVDVMYLHAPDTVTSFEETCRAMNEAYLEGKFERFGLSNYLVGQVEEIVMICKNNGFVLPSVYQGQYNPICRGAEDQLFKVLRKHNIAFYAYSPSACGFFSTKVSKDSAGDKDSRWNTDSPLGAKYTDDYFHDPLFAAAEIVRAQAKMYGISGHAAALRWTTWHSCVAAEMGDAIIIGASRLSQLEENLDILEQGPLPDLLVEVMDRIYMDVKNLDKGPRFSFV